MDHHKNSSKSLLASRPFIIGVPLLIATLFCFGLVLAGSYSPAASNRMPHVTASSQRVLAPAKPQSTVPDLSLAQSTTLPALTPTQASSGSLQTSAAHPAPQPSEGADNLQQANSISGYQGSDQQNQRWLAQWKNTLNVQQYTSVAGGVNLHISD